MSLFELDDFEETRVIWDPLYNSAGRCRDCGIRAGFNQGGARPGLGSFMVCDQCAQIDNCRFRSCTPVMERRKSRIGFNNDELAHCDCGWFVLDRSRWDDEFDADDLTDVLAQHAQPRHVSRWGESHLTGEHDALVSAQAKRRAKYLREVAA